MSDLNESNHNLSGKETNEWDNVVCLPIIDISQNYKEDLSTQELQFVTSKRLNEYISAMDISKQLSNINSESKSTNVLKLIKNLLFCTKTNISSTLRTERDRIFAIAIQPFDNRERFHLQCLYTIYSKLTENVTNGYRRFGHHWEEIGFQGTDPTTDFRGVGLLGLLQLTFFVVHPDTCKSCKQIYELSLDPVQHFPFAIMSMNITQISLQVLREGLLNRPINQSESVLRLFNQFYFATFLAFYKVWHSQHKTIIDTGYVLGDLRKFVRKDITKLLNECSKQKTTNSEHKYEEDFTNIGNIN